MSTMTGTLTIRKAGAGPLDGAFVIRCRRAGREDELIRIPYAISAAAAAIMAIGIYRGRYGLVCVPLVEEWDDSAIRLAEKAGRPGLSYQAEIERVVLEGVDFAEYRLALGVLGRDPNDVELLMWAAQARLIPVSEGTTNDW